MNISIAPGIEIAELRGKPITVVCEIAEGVDGKPELRALHPHVLIRLERWDGNAFFRLRRTSDSQKSSIE